MRGALSLDTSRPINTEKTILDFLHMCVYTGGTISPFVAHMRIHIFIAKASAIHRISLMVNTEEFIALSCCRVNNTIPCASMERIINDTVDEATAHILYLHDNG
jgi:hypothetical protein